MALSWLKIRGRSFVPGDLKRLRAVWRTLGDEDPLWAILSQPDKRGGGWDLDEFFAKGEAEIAALDIYSAQLGVPQARRRALDFGCGVGRLTRALTPRYAQVIGVDVSPSMIAKARTLNRALTNIKFVENRHPHLRFIKDGQIDLVCSVITLQHMPAVLQGNYMSEFFRVLAPEGLAVFQLACGYSKDWRGTLYRLAPNWLLNPLRRYVHDSRAVFEMHVFPEHEVEKRVAAAGLRILHVEDVGSAGVGFRSRRFFVGR